MTAFHARRDEDVAKLKQLERQTSGRIRVINVSGTPISSIGLRFQVRTAADSSYPSKSVSEVDATIQLGARYPFEEPSVSLSTKVFNPNVYTSGRVCLGSKWISTEFLDLLAQRLFKILAFDDSIVNAGSAANGDAARWYTSARSKHPNDFPSDRLNRSSAEASTGVKWNDVSNSSQSATHTIIPCPSCKTKLRLPANKNVMARCPSCKHEFPAQT